MLSKLQVDEATRTLRLTGSASLPMVSPHVYTPNYIRCGVSDGKSSYYGATALSGQSTVIKVRHADLMVEAFTDLRETGTAHIPQPFCLYHRDSFGLAQCPRELAKAWAAVGTV